MVGAYQDDISKPKKEQELLIYSKERVRDQLHGNLLKKLFQTNVIMMLILATVSLSGDFMVIGAPEDDKDASESNSMNKAELPIFSKM